MNEVKFQLRLKPKGKRSEDFIIHWPVLPRLGETIHYDLGEAGSVFWVEAVDHFMFGEEAPTIMVVATWKIVRIGEIG